MVDQEEQLVEQNARAPDDLFARHAAIQAQQTQLAIRAQRRELEQARQQTRAESEADPVTRVTREFITVIRSAGDKWAWQLEADGGKRNWQRALGVAIGKLDLTPEQVGVILRSWDDDARKHGLLDVEADRVRGVPPRQWLWSRHEYLANKLRTAEQAKPTAGYTRRPGELRCISVDPETGEPLYEDTRL